MQSDFSPSGRGGRGRGGRGGGGRRRGHGRGRGQDNGGRGRGGGRGGGSNDTRYHSPEEWNKLSQEQRMKILEARGTKRNINAVITDGTPIDGTPQDDASQQSNRQRTNACGNAGDQFGPRAHNVGMMRTSARMSSFNRQSIAAREISRATMRDMTNEPMFIELDSHADTVCVGANCRIIEYMQEMVNVEPYHPQYRAFRLCKQLQLMMILKQESQLSLFSIKPCILLSHFH